MADSEQPMDVTRLVLDHHEVLYRYAYRLTGSVADAEDLTQQVFLIAQTKARQVRDPGSMRCWLYTVLRNCYLKSRRLRVPLTATSLDLEMDHLPQRTSEPNIDGERLQAAINSLPEEFKWVVMLFYFEQRSYREVAEILQVPLGTVMSRLSRARGHLRSYLVEPEEHQVLRACEPDAPQATQRVIAVDHGLV